MRSGDSKHAKALDRAAWPLRWRTTREPPELSHAAIHIWRLPLDGEWPDPQAAHACLSPEEIRRAEAMRSPAVRRRHLRAQLGLRRVLAAYLGTAPRELVIARARYGKPYLAGDHGGLEFNLTTTADLALVAVGAGAPLGIDCEPLRPRRHLEAIARRMFPPEVLTELDASPGPERLHRFHLAWTALEADVKADGRGLARRRDAGAIKPAIAHCEPAPGYIAAVARVGLSAPETWRGFLLEDF